MTWVQVSLTSLPATVFAPSDPRSGTMSAYVTLATGQRMPTVGLGTWKSAPGQVPAALLPLGSF